MKSGSEQLNYSRWYRAMKNDLISEYGKDQVESLWKVADAQLEHLLVAYRDIPKGHRMHIHNTILPRIAIYRALQQAMPEDAMGIMDETVKKQAMAMGGMLGSILKFPGMKGFFILMFRVAARKMFGPSAGFAQTFHHADKGSVMFDITQCPYCEVCSACGCWELTHTFCDSDVYCYGALPGIVFERTQTLGTGGACCDFKVSMQRTCDEGKM